LVFPEDFRAVNLWLLLKKCHVIHLKSKQQPAISESIHPAKLFLLKWLSSSLFTFPVIDSLCLP
jgi:hypothetical protein